MEILNQAMESMILFPIRNEKCSMMVNNVNMHIFIQFIRLQMSSALENTERVQHYCVKKRIAIFGLYKYFAQTHCICIKCRDTKKSSHVSPLHVPFHPPTPKIQMLKYKNSYGISSNVIGAFEYEHQLSKLLRVFTSHIWC